MEHELKYSFIWVLNKTRCFGGGGVGGPHRLFLLAVGWEALGQDGAVLQQNFGDGLWKRDALFTFEALRGTFK